MIIHKKEKRSEPNWLYLCGMQPLLQKLRVEKASEIGYGCHIGHSALVRFDVETSAIFKDCEERDIEFCLLLYVLLEGPS